MQLTNLEIKQLILELKPLVENSFLNKIQKLPNNWIKIKIQTKKGGKNLIITPNAFFITAYKMEARQNPSGFSSFLKKHLFNKKIKKFEQHELERIAVIEFENFFLFLEFFGKGNIVFTDKKKEILRAFNARTWAHRSLKKGEKYRFPPARGLNILKTNFKEFKQAFQKSKKDSIRTLISEFNTAPEYCEKAFKQSKIEKNIKASELNDLQLKKILNFLQKIYSVIPAKSLNEKIDETLAKNLIMSEQEPEENKKIEALKRTLEMQKKSLKNSLKKSKELEQKAQAIYSNYAKIQQDINTVKQNVGKKSQKEIMYKTNYVKKIDLKQKKLTIETD